MRKRFHGLKKPKARQDWSKWTLYNISRMTLPPAANKTFFQQKWLAKSMSRAYHGNQIREGQWTRMFDRRLPAVVSMDHRILAKTDGSDMAAGRGRGLDPAPVDSKDGEGDGAKRTSRFDRGPPTTPYMHMTYWPIERRLDTAIFRSLFSSSAKQARQFVVHGFVKVNGKKMIYPGYLLNPGDMFSVEPERVLFATGARKHDKNSPEAAITQSAGTEQEVVLDEEGEDVLEQEAGTAEQAAEEDLSNTPAEDSPDTSNPREAIVALMARAKKILSDPKDKLSGKRKQDLRSFSQSVKRTLSKIRGTEYSKKSDSTPLEDTIDSLEEALSTITSKIPSAESAAPTESTTTSTTGTPSDTTATDHPQSSNPQVLSNPTKIDAYASRKDAELLHAALQRAQENPIDVRKPYATPWRPRDYMSAFAFIPRYLEVNQNICSAVYLRHPVARPGLAEVPTPFHGETMALAHNWYLRRR